MSLRFIYGRSGYGKSHFCLNDISNKLKTDETHPLILIVPEQFSFQAEKNLMKIIDRDRFQRVKIMSFRRMAHRVFTEIGGITREHMNTAGRAMLIHKILSKHKNDLELYSKSASSPGFVDTISQIIIELKRYMVTAEELEKTVEFVSEEILKKKLMDISLIYSNYETDIHEKYIDTEDDMELLYQKLDKTKLFDGAEIYLDEFSSFTPQQYKIIEMLMTCSSRVNIALTTSEKPQGDLFEVTSLTENRLLKIAAENNTSLDKPIKLFTNLSNRFQNSLELTHLERQLYEYPYKPYSGAVKDISIYKAVNIYEEVEETARDISRLIRNQGNGIRYRDIAIATRDMQRYESLVRAIFAIYEIPCFIDQRREMGTNPFIIFITAIVEIFSKNWTYESVFRCLKTGMFQFDPGELEMLENYVLAAGIKGKRWFDESWEFNLNYDFYNKRAIEAESASLEKINQVKAKITNTLGRLYHSLHQSSLCKDYAAALFDFVEENKIGNRLQDYINYFTETGSIDKANEYSQVWRIFCDVLDQAVEVLGDEKLTLDEFGKILMLGFAEYSTGIIPPSIDQVTLGNIDRMRSHEVKVLYVLGVNDGVLPRAQNDEGALNDQDRDKLRELGIELSMGTRSKVFEEQFLIYSSLTLPSMHLRLSYPIADHDGKTMRPSIVISRVKRLFPGLTEQSSLAGSEGEFSELKNLWAPIPAFNELIVNLPHNNSNLSSGQPWKELYEWFESKPNWKSRTELVERGLHYTNMVEEIKREKAAALYGKEHLFSVSRLEKYAECPFAYFVKYGLKAKDRKIYMTSSPDIGTFLHNVLNEFSELLKKEKLSWKDVDKKLCKEGVNLIVKDMMNKLPGNILNSSARYRQLMERLKKVLVTALYIIAEHIKRSEFEPTGFEEGFGPYDKYPPITIELENGEEIKLIGRIDRIDMMEHEEETFVRIIDYKSGNKDIRLTDIYYGLQLQLLTYLDAILKGYREGDIKSLTAAGILYFRVDDPMIKGGPGMSDEQLEKEILKELKLKGLLLSDYEVITGMDKDISGNSDVIQASVNKDGTLGSRSRVISREQFDVLRDYVNVTIKQLSTEMLQGKIDIKPYKKKKDTPCKFCDYSSICRFDTGIKGNNYRQLTEKSEDTLWELMGKKVNGGDSDE